MQTFCCSKKQLELIRGAASRGEQQNNFTHWDFRHPLPLVPADRGSHTSVFEASSAQSPWESLFRMLGLIPRAFCFRGLGSSRRICISNKFPGDAAGRRTTL